METMPNQVDVVRETLIDFCKDFVSRPYLCYTEHGLHALFYARLYENLPHELRYAECNGHQLCVVQKEYPTAHTLGRSKRQHWDISLIKTPIIVPNRPQAFDCLPLASVVEFGLNCSSAHLENDIERLCHVDANVERRFIVHLYRLSNSGRKFSGRDWSPESTVLCSRDSIKVVLRNRPVEVFFGIADVTGTYPSGLWLIKCDSIEQLM